MTPLNIVAQAKAKGLQLIAVTDHNSTLQGPVVRQVCEREGIAVIYGAEITTREEVHCLAYVGSEEQRVELQHYLEKHLPHVPNNPDIFGYQLWVDEFLKKAEVQAEAAAMMTRAQTQAQMEAQQPAPPAPDQAMGAEGAMSQAAFGNMNGAGMNPAMGGTPPAMGAPSMTREAITGQPRGMA